MDSWAFTVKILQRKKPITEASYEPFFKLLYKYGNNIVMIAEMDTKKILHFHGCVTLPTHFYRKQLCIKGFHVKLKTLYNSAGWTHYMYKNYKYSSWDKNISLICTEKINVLSILKMKPKKKKKTDSLFLTPMGKRFYKDLDDSKTDLCQEQFEILVEEQEIWKKEKALRKSKK